MPVKNFIPSLGNLPENVVITNKFSRKAADTLIGPNNKKQRSDDDESGNRGDVIDYDGGKSRSSKKRVSKTRKSTKRNRRNRRHRRRTSRK